MGKSLATASESVRTKGRAFIEAARRLAGELSVRVQGSEVIEHLQRELDSVSSDAQDSKKIEGNLLTLPPQPTSAGPGPVDPRSLPDLAIFRDLLSDGTEGPEMVILPKGRFLMGSPDDEKGHFGSEGPRHEVEIDYRFAIGRYPVTVAEYTAFCVAISRERPEGEGRLPVTGVSWEDARGYCRWISKMTGAAYRLPSEAEWEYACRAGTTTAYWWGAEWDASKANGARDWPFEKTRTGHYPANPWGLYDVIGNVREWCADAWRANYAEPNILDTAGEPADDRRVVRGGAAQDNSRNLRSADRNRFEPDRGGAWVGFRVARTLASLSS